MQAPTPYAEDYRQRPASGIVSRDYVVYDPHGNYDDSLSYAAPDYEPTDGYHQNHLDGDEPREPLGAEFGGPEGQPYDMAEYPSVGPPATVFPSTAQPNAVVDPTFYHPPRGSPAMKPFVAPGLSIPDHLIPAFKDAAVSSGAWPPAADVNAVAAAAAAAGATARRKGLPAWLRDELERLEKKKAKDVAKGSRDLSPTDDVNRDDEGDVVMDEAVNATTTSAPTVVSHKSQPTVLSDEEDVAEEDLERPTHGSVVDSLTRPMFAVPGSEHGAKSTSSAVSSPGLGALGGVQDLRAPASPAGGLTETEFQTLFRGLPKHIRQAEIAQFITRTLTDALLCVTTELLVLVAQEAHSEVRAVRVREAEEVARRAAEEHRAALLRKSAAVVTQRSVVSDFSKSSSGGDATATSGLTGLVAYDSESEAESEAADETAPSDGKAATANSPPHQQQPQGEQEQPPEATANAITSVGEAATIEVSEEIPSESVPVVTEAPSSSVSKVEKKSANVSEKPSTVRTLQKKTEGKSANAKTHKKSSSKRSPVKEKTPHSRRDDERDAKRSKTVDKKKKKTHSTSKEEGLSPPRGRHRVDVEETKKERHKKRRRSSSSSCSSSSSSAHHKRARSRHHRSRGRSSRRRSRSRSGGGRDHHLHHRSRDRRSRDHHRRRHPTSSSSSSSSSSSPASHTRRRSSRR